ncbi:(pine wood nematode) hypothetical protein [Aphelenchoides fujianensis]|nr:(pine wood nematode) hypothetical protein [Aphelenchoides fujianensis]
MAGFPTFVPLIVLAIIYAITRLIRFYVNVRAYPRGPLPLPFVGNFLQIDTANPHRAMAAWARAYGGVFTVWLPKPVVVLAEMPVLQEALLYQADSFAGRPMSFLYNLFTKYNKDGDGIILCRGPRWQAQRRFALRAFRTLGMGKPQMEARIGVHLHRLLEQVGREVEKGEGKATLDLHHNLAFCFGNIIHDLVMGRHYEENDPEFLRFKQMLDNILQSVASVQMLLVDNYPWLRFFLPTYYRYLSQGFELQNFFIQEIQRHEAKLDPNAEPDNFIDCYLRDMKSESRDKYDRQTLALNAGDLWTGGLETVVTTVRWGILFLIHHPDIQAKCQAEVDEVAGREPLTLAHRNRTPFLHATMDELQRMVNVLPWNIPHCVEKDVMVGQHFIRAGTTVMPQLGAVMFDERVFPQPERFDPERFMSRDKHAYVPHPSFIPFGLGKRACLGKQKR